jgi:hypothetical protein
MELDATPPPIGQSTAGSNASRWPAYSAAAQPPAPPSPADDLAYQDAFRSC